MHRAETCERDTKAFFRQFKAASSTQYIAEIITTPNWDHPEVKGPVTSDPQQVRAEIAKYWQHLFRRKPRPPEGVTHAGEIYKAMNENKLTDSEASPLEAEINEDEVVRAILRTKANRAAGPDLIPPEFYKTFATMIAPYLHQVFNEAHENNELPASMLTGDIILLFKEKGTRTDVRNYRPITLLCVDYKILERALAERLKRVIGKLVSHSQLGFVPRRRIEHATQHLRLIQRYIDKHEPQGEGGVVVSLDMVKAYDMVDWDYLSGALQACGIGPKFRHWIGMMYNNSRPPQRRMAVNGFRGDEFPILSGVAQGSVLAPLLFLFVAEALAITAERHPHLQGIQIGPSNHLLVQFADDTDFTLKDFNQIKHMEEVMLNYGNATGMRENVSKRQSTPLGRCRFMQPPNLQGRW